MKWIGEFLMGLGALVLLGVLLFPLVGDSIVSELRKTTDSIVVEVPKASTDDSSAPELVEVRQYSISVTNSGGEAALDACSGGFTEMLDQRGLEEKVLLSAHNNCGGDVLLPIVVGDRVVIEGRGVFEVIDSRDVSKTASTSAVADMNGSILLQTCYYGDGRMKFLGLTPIGGGLAA